MGSRVLDIWELLKATFNDWSKDEAPRLGASLAFYAAFSLTPLLVIMVAIVGIFYREDSIVQIERQMTGQVGPEVAGLLSTAIANSKGFGAGLLAIIIGGAFEIMGATAVFVELRSAMNRVFQVQPRKPSGATGFLRTRAAAFAMVLASALLLLAEMVISAALSAATPHFNGLPPIADYLWRVLDSVVSIGITTLLFAMLFRYLPDARLPWKDLWIGAAVTAILFAIGAYVIGLYLARGAVGSTFGAAGTLMVLLAWVYYSAQIVFFGAEFTQVYSKRYGSRAVPSDHRRAA